MNNPGQEEQFSEDEHISLEVNVESYMDSDVQSSSSFEFDSGSDLDFAFYDRMESLSSLDFTKSLSNVTTISVSSLENYNEDDYRESESFKIKHDDISTDTESDYHEGKTFKRELDETRRENGSDFDFAFYDSMESVSSSDFKSLSNFTTSSVSYLEKCSEDDYRESKSLKRKHDDISTDAESDCQEEKTFKRELDETRIETKCGMKSIYKMQRSIQEISNKPIIYLNIYIDEILTELFKSLSIECK